MKTTLPCRLRRCPAPHGIARSLLLHLPVLVLAACGDASGDGAGSDGARTLVPATEEVFRIGSVDGGSWDSFSRIVAAGFDAVGNLYVLDGSDGRVTVVDPAGRFIRTVGQPGDGPGELRMPVAMAVLPDGRVVVSDAGRRGLSLFDADGTYVRSLPLGDGIAAPVLLYPHGDDAVVYSPGGMMVGPGGGFGQAPTDAPIYRLAVEGEDGPELLHRAWLPPREPPRVTTGAGGTMVRRTLRAFEPRLHVAVLPDGVLAVADSTSYRIDILRPGQGVDATVDRGVAPVPVTDREREREKARRLQELEDGGGAAPRVTMMGPGGAQAPDRSQMRSILEAQLEGMTFWPEIQAIQELASDREGRLWVRRFGDVDEPGPIEILGRDGTLSTTVPAGALAMPAAFGPDGVAAWIERDELDVPFVRVARLKLD